MRRLGAGFVLLALVVTGCSSARHRNASVTTRAKRPHTRRSQGVRHRAETPAARALGLPAVSSRVVPGYVLVADRNNNRVLIISPAKRVVWRASGLRGPDDAF